MSKIIRLSSTNYKRLKAVEIKPDPDGNLVIVAGKNGQGKSSVLDSITAALGGVNAKTTPKPIRDGEDRAEIVLETEDLTVTRRFTASGSTLTVATPDGAKFSKGQAKLDDLLGKLSLDPLAFTQLSDRDQLATLLDLVDLPFNPAELDAERKALYDQRAEVGRQGKSIGDVVVDDSLPGEETSATEIIAKIREAQAVHREYAEARDAVATAEAKVDELKAELANWEATLAGRQRDLDSLPDELPSIEDWESKLATVEESNAAIRANNDAKAHADRKNQLRAQYSDLTGQIEALDKSKADGLAKAAFPVDGLGFDDGGVTYQGVPFKQASSAEQLRVSLAMAIALNPSLRVIRIADGSLLDGDNLALIESMAREHDFQVWIEIVGNGDGTGVVIEDGEVA